MVFKGAACYLICWMFVSECALSEWIKWLAVLMVA